MAFKCKYFTIAELVPKDYYERFGERCWEIFDERALKTLDALREKFGPATINYYPYQSGGMQYRGLRTSAYYGSGSKNDDSRSQHKYGRAFDITFKNISAKDVRKYVIEHKDEFPFITFLEIDITWFHFDVRNTEGIKLWSPDDGFITEDEFLRDGGR